MEIFEIVSFVIIFIAILLAIGKHDYEKSQKTN